MATIIVNSDTAFPITGSLELHLFAGGDEKAIFYREITDFDAEPDFEAMETGIVNILRYARSVLGDTAFQVKLTTTGFILEV